LARLEKLDFLELPGLKRFIFEARSAQLGSGLMFAGSFHHYQPPIILKHSIQKVA
jgi:hypothetical protein